ncbi:MAG: OsmC family protein [Candidatus Bipolaricaulia bacterium]
MADIVREATAVWRGSLQAGKGTTSTGSGTLHEAAYSFPSRFESGEGTNPEELMASAHASCFSMALSMVLGQQGHEPEEIRTRAHLTLAQEGEGFKISKIHLETTGRVPGISADDFQSAAEAAKENCPVSLLFRPGLDELTLEAALE